MVSFLFFLVFFFFFTDTKCNSTVNSTNNSVNNNHESNSKIKQNSVSKNCKINEENASGETLDLGDLDLSQLRLTKKDLEALSNLTPNLPKHCQDQLLAQLPPTQARKLSRTLSMQGTSNHNQPMVYKRSLSGGRDIPMVRDHTNSVGLTSANEEETDVSVPFDRSSILRRSLSRGRATNLDNGVSGIARRSISSVRSSDLPNRLSYTGDIRGDSTIPKYRYTDTNTPTTSLRSEYYSRLPPSNATCLSPPPIPPSSSNEALDSPIRRRSTTRRVSRFLRPDFYDSSSNLATTDDSASSRLKRERERETQSVLREIRERSRDRARRESSSYLPTPISDPRPNDSYENGISAIEKEHRRKSNIPNIRIIVDDQNNRSFRARNKSVERCCDVNNAPERNNNNIINICNEENLSNHRGACVSRNVSKESQSDIETASDFTDKILNELVLKSQEAIAKSEAKENGIAAVKKLKIKSKDTLPKTKAKQKSIETETENANNETINLDSIVITNDVDTVTMTLPKPASKLTRPKSYPVKDAIELKKETSPVIAVVVLDKKKNNDSDDNSQSNATNVELTLRPKSFPNSKLTPPKEFVSKVNKKTSPAASSSSSNSSNGSKNAITAVMEKFIEKSAERLSPAKNSTKIKSKTENGVLPETPTKTVKKKIKIVKKTKAEQPNAVVSEDAKTKDVKSESSSPTKTTKSPEKKVKSGFLYSIGQKFEKMRENSKLKEKKPVKSTESPTKIKSIETKEADNTVKNIDESQNVMIENKKFGMLQQQPLPQMPITVNCSEQRKSRIDAMIRNLRERSVPQSAPVDSPSLGTESSLIKRAISVEDMINGSPNLHKCNVNKVLGLFRRIEREHLENAAQNQIANSNMQMGNGCVDPNKERPKSGGFVSKLKKTSGRPYYTGAKSDTIVTLTDQIEKQYLADKMNQSLSPMNNSKIPTLKSTSPPKLETNKSTKCPDCGTEDCKDITSLDDSEDLQSKLRRFSYNMNKLSEAPVRNQNHSDTVNNRVSEKERIRNNRKGLILDLNPAAFDITNNFNAINNNGYSNGNDESNINNNNITKNLNNNNYTAATTPSCDDCESTSTFLSPTEEPELCFDDWSLCSSSIDEHTRASPLPPIPHSKYTPTSSRHSFKQHHHCPGTSTSTSIDPPSNSDSESVIDRIKRRSFYCRFNEKKPKRTSSIVGPAARDFYRDMASRTKHHGNDDISRALSKSPTPINRSTESGINSPTSTLDDADHVHYHYHHTPRSTRYDRDITPVRSSEYPNLRATLTSPPAATSKYIPKVMSTSDYLPNGNHRSYRGSIYDGLTPSASSSSTSSTSPFIYGTYNPKHRISSSSSYLSPSNGLNDFHSQHHHHPVSNSYATISNRTKQRPYDHRSISLLDPNAISSYSLPTKRLTGTDHQHPNLRSVNDFSTIGSR